MTFGFWIAILNPEFKKSGKIRQCQAPARYEIRQKMQSDVNLMTFEIKINGLLRN